MERIILHVDMDAFFAAVEVLDNPGIKNKPVIVGGTSSRGVVATCSYEARAFGVHSAMPIFKARALCPNGIYIPPRHWRYKEISNEIFKILYRFTDIIEPLSIDEAYLDISHLKENPIEVASKIKKNIKEEIGLNISIGISYNKFLAKLASDWNKPNGLKVIKKEEMPKILFPLNIRKVYGIGAKSAEKLFKIGVQTVEDLYNLPIELYKNYFGKSGEDIYWRIRGRDERRVTIKRERKSYGKETTFADDICDKTQLWNIISGYSDQISFMLKSKNLYGKTVTIKYKTINFETHTRSKTVEEYFNENDEIKEISREIFDSIEFNEAIRLIGVTVSNLSNKKNFEQLNFFDI
ncbi:DNA polymerase IV [Oceanirhabdus sp. W0125-5]|uniref:DNA polymerase IV n=1 Tax=Oceanirhabdus sp. W0125-5 TaxID=2999116 RepID=UPI0022F2AA24|nr:DNA polymerase IV [Oceanirhabdus sp. W0125-5]WBW99355.1 DNA polymerase IV [Oceanirhabdus sp. W0125-5]